MIYFRRPVYFTFTSIVTLVACIIIYQMYLMQTNDKLYDSDVSNNSIILWWTPFGTSGKLRKCGDFECYFTNNRSFQYHRNIKSILFYGSNFQATDLPTWRSKSVSWGLLHEESPRNNPILVQRKALNLFSYSSTFSRFSDIPLTFIDLPGHDELLSKKYFVSTEDKNRFMDTKELAPLLYIQSDCDTASNRDVYVAELMKHIRIDSYGTCLNNVQLNRRLKENYLEILDKDEFLSFAARYKFTVAFENAVCFDYITEKLWRPLIVGSVPIYYGSPTFKDWLPNNSSAISVLDFRDPKSLGEFLLKLSDDDTEYNKYLSHKLIENYEIENGRLKEALREKEKENYNHFGDYVEKFECFVCESSQEKGKARSVNSKDYNCPLPKNPLTHKTDYNNWWTEQWIREKCGAKVLSHYLENNITIDVNNFQRDKMKLYDQNDC